MKLSRARAPRCDEGHDWGQSIETDETGAIRDAVPGCLGHCCLMAVRRGRRRAVKNGVSGRSLMFDYESTI